MAKACVHIGIYSRVSCGAGNESIFAIGAIPHAGNTIYDALCCICHTSCQNQRKSAKMVPYCIGNRGDNLFGLELV